MNNFKKFKKELLSNQDVNNYYKNKQNEFDISRSLIKAIVCSTK